MLNIQKHVKTLLTTSVLLVSVSGIAAAPQSFTGSLSDAMCGAKHMMPGKTDAECTRECAKANSKYALVVDKKVYTLSGPQEEFSRLAGKRVRVTGRTEWRRYQCDVDYSGRMIERGRPTRWPSFVKQSSNAFATSG